MTETKMNPEAKTAWLDALRSGEYEQGEGKLCRPAHSAMNRSDKDKFCCLGVLTDVAMKLGKVQLTTHEDESAVTYVSQDGPQDDAYLPDVVREWSGLQGYNPQVEYTYTALHGGEATAYEMLANLNDSGHYDFAKIADLIETNF